MAHSFPTSYSDLWGFPIGRIRLGGTELGEETPAPIVKLVLTKPILKV
jgi:hypothetical protein